MGAMRCRQEAALLHAKDAVRARKASLDFTIKVRSKVHEQRAGAIQSLQVVKNRLAELRRGPLAVCKDIRVRSGRKQEIRRRRCSWLPRKRAALQSVKSSDLIWKLGSEESAAVTNEMNNATP